jgi:hypothetical protein
MEGAGLNLTLMSYLDAIDFSYLVDAELVPDVWDMARMTTGALRRAADGRTRASRVAVSAGGCGDPCAAARTVHLGAACTAEGCGHAEARRAQGRGGAE